MNDRFGIDFPVMQPTIQSNPNSRTQESFLPLLVSLVLCLAIAPLGDRFPLVSSLLFSLLLLAGIFAVVRSRALFVAAVSGLVIALPLRWLAHYLGNEYTLLVVLAHLASGAYLGFLGGIVVVRVLAHQKITRDTVVGAMCGYLLIAYVFGFAYGALVAASPDALALGSPHSLDVSRIGRDAWAMMYFSFVTLCTLGYGDIVPVSPIARSLAILEVLSGQLYLAAFVARLVGAMAASSRGENRS